MLLKSVVKTCRIGTLIIRKVFFRGGYYNTIIQGPEGTTICDSSDPLYQALAVLGSPPVL